MAQASNIVFSAYTAGSVRVTVTRGSGAGVLLCAQSGTSFAGTPNDTTVYAPSSVFGSGDAIPGGGFAVGVSTASGDVSFNITGLDNVGTQYTFRAFEYDGGVAYDTSTAMNNPRTLGVEIIAMGTVKSANDAWSLVGGLTKPLAVELPDDNDTSYIVSTGASTSQEFNLAAHGIPPSSSVASVKIVRRHKRDGASNSLFTAMVFLDGNSQTAGAVSAMSSYATTTSGALLRPGGGDWQVEDLASTSVRVSNSNANNTRVTTLYVEVQYIFSATAPTLTTATSTSGRTGGRVKEKAFEITSDATGLCAISLGSINGRILRVYAVPGDASSDPTDGFVLRFLASTTGTDYFSAPITVSGSMWQVSILGSDATSPFAMLFAGSDVTMVAYGMGDTKSARIILEIG